MTERKTSRQKIVQFFTFLSIILGIFAAIAGITGKNIGEWVDKTFGLNKINCIAPNITGKREEVAILELKQLGFEIVERKTYSEKYNSGYVITQNPLPNAEIKGCEGKFIIEVSANKAEHNDLIKIPSTQNLENERQVKESDSVDIFNVVMWIAAIVGVIFLIVKIVHVIF